MCHLESGGTFVAVCCDSMLAASSPESVFSVPSPLLSPLRDALHTQARTHAYAHTRSRTHARTFAVVGWGDEEIGHNRTHIHTQTRQNVSTTRSMKIAATELHLSHTRWATREESFHTQPGRTHHHHRVTPRFHTPLSLLLRRRRSSGCLTLPHQPTEPTTARRVKPGTKMFRERKKNQP